MNKKKVSFIIIILIAILLVAWLTMGLKNVRDDKQSYINKDTFSEITQIKQGDTGLLSGYCLSKEEYPGLIYTLNSGKIEELILGYSVGYSADVKDKCDSPINFDMEALKTGDYRLVFNAHYFFDEKLTEQEYQKIYNFLNIKATEENNGEMISYPVGDKSFVYRTSADISDGSGSYEQYLLVFKQGNHLAAIKTYSLNPDLKSQENDLIDIEELANIWLVKLRAHSNTLNLLDQ